MANTLKNSAQGLPSDPTAAISAGVEAAISNANAATVAANDAATAADALISGQLAFITEVDGGVRLAIGADFSPTSITTGSGYAGLRITV